MTGEQKQSVAAACRARDQYVGQYMAFMKGDLMDDERPPARPVWPVPGRNSAAAATLRKECDGKADPLLVDAICTIMEDSHQLPRVVSSKEVQTLQALLVCKCHKLTVARAISETSKEGLKLSELFRFIDRYASPFLLSHEAVRKCDEKAYMAARKRVDPLFGVTKHPKYFLAAAVDIKQEESVLSGKALEMLKKFVMMRFAPGEQQWQTADDILEQLVRQLKHLVGPGDSDARWDQANADMETKRVDDDAFFNIVHLWYMQQAGKQRVRRNIEPDIRLIADGVRPMIGKPGHPCTLGGIPLLEDGLNLTQEINGRVHQLEGFVQENKDGLFLRRAPTVEPVEVVDRVAVARNYRRRPRSSGADRSDNENEVRL